MTERLAAQGHMTLGERDRRSPIRVRSAGVLLAAVVMTLTGCTTHTSTGTVTGRFGIWVGGVAYRTVPGVGKLVVEQQHRVVSTTQIISGHQFRVNLPVGTYQVTATTSQATCQPVVFPGEVSAPAPVTVTVTSNRSVAVQWSCAILSAVG
jgi:hypothetical protein